MKLTPIPAATGRIKKILLADPNESKEYNSSLAMERYGAIIKAFAKYAEEGIEIWIFAKRAFSLCETFEDVTYSKEKEKFGQMRSKGTIDAFEAFRARVFEKAKAEMDKEPAMPVFDLEKQVRIIRPNLDFKEIGKEILESGLLKESSSLVNMPEEERNEFSEWIQDPFFILRTEENYPVILDPYYYPKGSYIEKFIAEQIASQQEVLIKPTRFFFQGGNLLAEANFLLFGTSDLYRNMERYCTESFTELTSFMKEDFGVDHILFPGLNGVPDSFLQVPRQPEKLFHLDLFLTLGGRNVAGKQVIFVGELFKAESGGTDPNFELEKVASADATYLDEMEAWFRNYCGPDGQLEFEVDRLPIVYLDDGTQYSYNNCFVERFQGKAQVFLPGYRPENPIDRRIFSLADEIAIENLVRQGFDVRVVPHYFFALSQRSSGSFHCITKVMQRG